MDRKTWRGLVMASAVVGLLGSGYGLAAGSARHGNEADKEKDKQVKCQGINSCSGKGECAAADGSHDCAGMNSCKGKGWVKATEAECKEKGGKVLDAKKDKDD